VPVVPPDPAARFSPAHLLRAVSQTMPKAAVADGEYIQDLLTKTTRACATLRSLHWLAVDELERGNDGPVQAQEGYAGCGPVELYLIQYTSGATGVPRPVTVTAGSAAHNVRAARTAYALHTGSVVVSWLPQYHDCGLMFLLLTVVTGATCVLASPDAFVWRPRLWLELVAEFGARARPWRRSRCRWFSGAAAPRGRCWSSAACRT
jgi:acyl-CoA synthetase (AMP-forming)/AMP-acid ligase II